MRTFAHLQFAGTSPSCQGHWKNVNRDSAIHLEMFIAHLNLELWSKVARYSPTKFSPILVLFLLVDICSIWFWRFFLTKKQTNSIHKSWTILLLQLVTADTEHLVHSLVLSLTDTKKIKDILFLRPRTLRSTSPCLSFIQSSMCYSHMHMSLCYLILN